MLAHPDGCIELFLPDEDLGTDTMRGTWFMWMGEISDHYKANGIRSAVIGANGSVIAYRDFEPDDAHNFCCNLFMGSDSSGKRYSWKMTNDDGSAASRAQRLQAMDRVVQMASEQGISLTIKKHSDYWDYRELQEA